MKELAPGLMVTSQIALTRVERLAAAGVKTLIMNRPDGEEPGQPTAAALRAAAEAHGLSFHHIPVSGGHFPAEAVAAMAAALEGSKGPVVAFCRSGARSATLWALGRAGKDPPDAIIAAGQRVGIDLAPLRSRLQPQGEPWP
ncbi:TIGR01244 family sulfur transferase [Thermaurantiacus sp.]